MEHNDILQPILILLITAILSVAAVQRLRLSPILGYFLAGILVGPYSLGLVDNTATIQSLAEVGVAFLLFDIGLNLSFKKLWEARKDLFGLGPFQMIGTTLLVGGLAYWLTKNWITALIIGAGISLSSTAVVMQTLKEAKEENTPVGRSALAVLIGQDIFVVFLLILVPSLSSGQGNWIQPMLVSLLKALLALGIVSFVGRFLLRPVFEKVTATKNDDVFTESALLFVLATAWGVSRLGLSLPLGAFLAGLALSESDYCYLVKTEIHPFRGLLLGLFFITVGMSLNWPLALQQALPLFGLIAGLIVLKIIALWTAGRLMRFCQGGSVYLAFLLAQGSEFAFVLFTLAITSGLLDRQTGQLLQVAVGVTLALTPLLAFTGRKIGNRIENLKVDTRQAELEREKLMEEGAGKVIISGFDLIGQELAKILEAESIAYIAYDVSRKRVAEARSQGFQVEYADFNRPKTVREVSLGKAKAVVILQDDPETSLYVLNAIKDMNPGLSVYAATRDLSLYHQLQETGLADTFHKNPQTVSLIATELLKTLGLSDAKIADRLEHFKGEQESVLQEAFATI